jgi:tungstate transport system substrate-binding protein
MRRGARLAGAAALVVAATAASAAAPAPPATVVLATTTSTQDSGLLDVLLPLFERRSGYTVKPIAVGTGQALALAARGEADVVLSHAPELERRHVTEGRLLRRRLVMYNDFVLVGPPADPAAVRGQAPAEALRRIARTGARFVSRGDRSGTHALELALWQAAGVEPGHGWYIESGQGMGATLGIASDRRAYALTDRATWLAFQRRLDLPVLVEGHRALLNVYAVLETNPAGGPRVNAAGGRAFADFLLAPETQQVIRGFGVGPYGRPLFVPAAGRRDEDLGVSPDAS